jgi:hypothetical protein
VFTAEIVDVDAPRRLVWPTDEWSGSMAASVVEEHRAVLEKEYTHSAAASKAPAEAHDA